MKKTIIFLTVFLSLGLLLFWKYRTVPAKTIHEQQTDKSVKADISTRRKKLKDFRYQKKADSEIKYTFPKACQTSVENLTQLVANEYIEILKNKKIFDDFFSSDCQRELLSNFEFTRLAESYKCKMFEKGYFFNPDNKDPTCESFLFVMRAISIADQSSNIAVSKMTSQELAANFIKLALNMDKLKPESIEHDLELVNHFYERHPDDSSVVSAYLGYMTFAQLTLDTKIINDSLENAWERSRGMSFEVDRIAIMKDVLTNNFDSAKNTLDMLSERYPNEPDISYFQAAYFWKKGDRVKANRFLSKALENSKNGCSFCAIDIYKNTQDKLKNAKTGSKGLFSISIGLDFDQL